MKRRPVIGITGPDRGGLASYVFTAMAVLAAGGRPERMCSRTASRIGRFDGLIIGGGADVDPTLYSEAEEEPLPREESRGRSWWLWPLALVVYPAVYVLRKIFSAKSAGADPARDRLETALLRRAVDRRLPVLGICRGAQLANVFFGGTLYRELSGLYVETPEVRSILPRRRIAIRPGTRLGGILGAEPCSVNALHRQAIRDPGRDMVVSATDDNGIVQAIEHARLPFCIGVQWHPEYLPQLARQRTLIAAVVVAASQRRDRQPESGPPHQRSPHHGLEEDRQAEDLPRQARLPQNGRAGR